MEERITQSHRETQRVPTVNHITEAIIGAGIEIHRELGPGLLESVYESILEAELRLRGYAVERQVELMSVEKTAPVHKKQVLTYLKLTGLKVGLLLNFGCALFKDGVERIILGDLA